MSGGAWHQQGIIVDHGERKRSPEIGAAVLYIDQIGIVERALALVVAEDAALRVLAVLRVAEFKNVCDGGPFPVKAGAFIGAKAEAHDYFWGKVEEGIARRDRRGGKLDEVTKGRCLCPQLCRAPGRTEEPTTCCSSRRACSCTCNGECMVRGR